jgi:hypothetical protein
VSGLPPDGVAGCARAAVDLRLVDADVAGGVHYFRTGFGCQTLCADALVRIGNFYRNHETAVDARRVFTLDFDSGLDTERRYSKAKIIDMIFFQEGVNRERDRS